MSVFLKTLAWTIAGAAALTGAIHVVYAGKVLPNVSTGPLELGGRSPADAADLINARAQGLAKLTYTYQGKSFDIPAQDIGLKVDGAKTAEAAMQTGRSSAGALAVSPIGAVRGQTDVPLVYQLNEEALAERLAALTKSIGTPTKDAVIVRAGTEFRIVKERVGESPDLRGNVLAARAAIEQFRSDVPLYVRRKSPAITANDLTPSRAYADLMARRPLTVMAAERTFTVGPGTLAGWVDFTKTENTVQGSFLDQNDALRPFDEYLGVGQDDAPFIALKRRSLHADVDRVAVGQYVATVADQVDRPPENARLSFTDGQLRIAGAPKDGVVVDRPRAVGAIRDGVKNQTRTASVPIVAKKADIRQETLPQLGITTLIGKSTTTFAGSPPGRTYNIGVGAAKFNGVLIKPGEEFSFNQTLGDVGPETGYVPELVILERTTEKQYGGGLCQVSTTTFRAAMAAGLPITDRTNHSYAVQYYAPIGMDATIYPPDPDLKFRNNTKGHILIQASRVGESVTFEFYGTSDGRQARTEIIHIAATEAAGGTASFRYVVEGGPEPINRVFSSTYKPQSAFPTSDSLN